MSQLPGPVLAILVTTHIFDGISEIYTVFFNNMIKLMLKKIMTLLHNNTIKPINNTAKSSILIVILYHLKS